MIIILSPSKTLDFETPYKGIAHTQPEFIKESENLISSLRTYSKAKLAGLMDISDKLAALNVQRYQDFSTPFTLQNARQALLAFKGDVYDGIPVETYKKADFEFAQAHLRILSGLYGLLRPLDLIQPYRLEMGIALKNARGKDLYAFWGDRLTMALNKELNKHDNPVLVNLASQEYFAAVMPNILKYKIINVHFKENQKGKLKVVGLFAKKARGLMAHYVISKQLDDCNQLKEFTENGYSFEKSLSGDSDYIFVRG